MTNRGRLTLLEHMRQYPPIRLVSNNDLRRELSPACAQEIADALECWLLVEQLRAGEGAAIEICCSNPDFNGQANEVVVITDDWTAWKPRRFGGGTLLEALRAAKTVRDIEMRGTDAHWRSKRPAKPELCQGADPACHYPACACAIKQVAKDCCATTEERETCQRLCSNSRLPRP